MNRMNNIMQGEMDMETKLNNAIENLDPHSLEYRVVSYLLHDQLVRAQGKCLPEAVVFDSVHFMDWLESNNKDYGGYFYRGFLADVRASLEDIDLECKETFYNGKVVLTVSGVAK